MDPRPAQHRPEHVIVAILLALMAVIAFANVVSRYLLHFSFASTEEITINLFVWMTVVGTGIAFERGGQLGMITLYDRFPPRMQRTVTVLSAALSAALFILVDLYTIQAIHDEITVFHATSSALGVPVWVYYVGVPAFSVFVFLGIYRDAASRLAGPAEGPGP